MNIMIITAMFPPIRTGSSHYSYDLAIHLSKRGNDVIVATLKNNMVISDNYSIPVFRLSTIHLENLFKKHFKHFRISSFFINNYFYVNKLIKEHKIDAIFLVSHYHDIAFIAVAASIYNKVPLICSVNTQLQSIKSVMEKIFIFFDRLICGAFVFPFCGKIICLDNQIYAYLKNTHRKAADKSILIPYGVHGDSRVFLSYNHDYGFHNQLIGIGSVIEQRNFLFSIVIFNKLLKTFPDLKFKIIGHVYYDIALRLVERLNIKKQVIFMGELPHEDVLKEIRNSDIYMGIMSGRYTGLGQAALESMLMGVPVVSNILPDLFGDAALKDMRQYIYADIDYKTQNVDYLNSNVEPPDEISGKIAYVLKDATMRRSIGQGGRHFVAENLGWERIAEKVENVFLALINK